MVDHELRVTMALGFFSWSSMFVLFLLFLVLFLLFLVVGGVGVAVDGMGCGSGCGRGLPRSRFYVMAQEVAL